MQSNNQAMKRQSKLDRIPQPITLMGRKSSLKQPQDEPGPKGEWQHSALVQIENNCPMSSASLISNMKQELCSIKLDVEKLIMS